MDADPLLAILGAVALCGAAIRYGVIRLAPHARVAVHLSGMGVGSLAMLTFFYVDTARGYPFGACCGRCGRGSVPAAIGVPSSWAPYSCQHARLIATPGRPTILDRFLRS